MRNRSVLLEKACEAMALGDSDACQAALEQFRDSVARRPLALEEKTACTAQIDRLVALARAACEGIDATRFWLNEMLKMTGALEVYDRSGRHRVETSLAHPARRF